MCGKNRRPFKPAILPIGSPPRVREKSVGGSFMGCCDRITPACAGKIPAYRLSPHNFQDHPRVCGKNVAVYYFCYGVVGSPPRVREKSIISFCHCPNYRITPACAGKIASFKPLQTSVWDHPRVCGKNYSIYIPWVFIVGSPPRVREKFPVTAVVITTVGITPACAGKMF